MMEKKILLFYEKDKFDEFEKNLLFTNEKIYPISYLTDKNISLKYTSIRAEEHFVLDITAMVLSALVRNDLRIIYEGWINALNDSDDDISYCVEKTYLQSACSIFDYYFKTNEEIETVIEEKAIVNIEEKTEENVEENKKNNSIVYYGQEQFQLLMENFYKQLYGHEGFKTELGKQLKAFILLHRMKRKKVFSILLCGKSGIGKTEVARILQREMYPEESAIKINFGNYSGKGSLWSLIGSPKGYIGSEQGGELTNKIIHSHSKLIVIDELDKADESIFTFFYEMLEDGKYTDLDGKVIDLDGYIVVFTANLHNSNFKDMIPEPLFSRFDMTFEFEPLSTTDKFHFISDTTDELINEYISEIGSLDISGIKEKILKKEYEHFDNLRNIKRDIMNTFVELVGEESAWNKEKILQE